MIHADQLSKEFGRFQAVKNASFQIEKGEIVGFLGPNGAGKTTTLRMLTGYLPPTSGTATIAGFDIVKNPLEARKHLGYLPEHVPLYDDQRVTEYLKFRARLKGISSKQIWPAVSKVVEQCGLDPVRRKMIRTLSKGYRQRVGLADALLGEPDLLILDEPTNGLDIQSISWLEDFLIDFENTVIVVSHDRHFLNNVCTHIVDIDYGKIKMYVGNYDFWYESSQLIQQLIRNKNKRAEEKIAERERMADRLFRAVQGMRLSQRMSELDRRRSAEYALGGGVKVYEVTFEYLVREIV